MFACAPDLWTQELSWYLSFYFPELRVSNALLAVRMILKNDISDDLSGFDGSGWFNSFLERLLRHLSCMMQNGGIGLFISLGGLTNQDCYAVRVLKDRAKISDHQISDLRISRKRYN